VKSITYINRSSGKQCEEIVPGSGMMRFIYGKNPLAKLALWALFKRKIFSTIAGWYMINGLSAKMIKKFISYNEVDMDDYIIPEGGFKHFNSFFYRKLHLNLRPIGNGIVSPADGKLLVFNCINDSHLFFVKGKMFNLNSFLNNTDLAKKYDEGAMAIVRLAPANYHRYHFPIDGYVGENTKIIGNYYSVSPLALKKKMKYFCENKREYVEVESNKYGDVLICDVGATLTGSIVQSHWPNIDVKKGEEKGYFAFGGSTIILLFEKDKITFSDDLLKNTKDGFETSIKMGETIAS